MCMTDVGHPGLRVQRVVMPETEFESWTVLSDDQLPIQPVERFLAYLASIEKSPNTIKACAHDLKDWFVYLAGHSCDWRSVTLEDVAGFVAWLRLPPQARDGTVAHVGPAIRTRSKPPCSTPSSSFARDTRSRAPKAREQ